MTPIRLSKRLSAVTDLNAIAVTDLQRSLSYAQLFHLVDEVADWLAANAVCTLALHAENSVDWVIVDLACQQQNIINIPLPDFFSESQLENCLKETLVDMVLTNSPALVEKLNAINTTTTRLADVPVKMHAIALSPSAKHNELVTAQQRCPTATQKITFTSGSTGAPKGVCLSADHQWLTAQSLASTIDIRGSRHLCLLPLATLLENVAGIYAPLLSGGTVVVPNDAERGLSGSSGLDIKALLTCVSRVEPTTMILLPQLLTALLAACQQGWTPPESLKFIAVGGAKVAPQLLHQAAAFGLPVYEGYGLSECGSVVALNTVRHNRLGNVGKLLPHCQVVIENEQIIVSNSIFLGYYDDPESWYPESVSTGDLGSFSDGYLAVNGRQKNLIISSFGRNINPEWVESELLGRPLLQQCVVVGENRPYLVAFLTAPEQVSNIAISAWISSVNDRLPDYAQVGSWQRLPIAAWHGLLTANGRPQRQQINTQLAAQIEALYGTERVIERVVEKTHSEPNQLTLVRPSDMTFFERLKTETQAAQNYLLASPIMQRAMQGDISKHDYGAFLLQAYHHVKHTTPLLMAAGSRMPGSKEWLREALAEYIEEELGHQEWILNDLAKCGYDKEVARHSTPNRSTELMVAYAYDVINRINPVGFFGMVHVLEGTSVNMADSAASSIQTALGLPKSAFSYLRSHGAIDIEHVKFFETLMNRIDDPEDQAQIIHCAKMFYHLYGDIFRELDESQVHSIASAA